ncbi:TetR-like C-terminal domain-containing protein [Pseudaquidulcibacter saccharophilus]|uniref:TetR-like C-terminal domain-containing protein n=1 Tax=Pseudaquidulcibacter saccharophilus TaxID=2831900 RepID=UPI001EFF2AE1|nr:TetR-like C-terminal domain-containing protein [Pseudaquidulcibacter saccharophilus]
MAGGTEEIIINGAFRILDDKGHHFVDIQKIEEMYQLTPGSGKNYFADNGVLLLRLASIEIDNIIKSIPAVQATPSYGNVVSMMNFFIHWAQKYPYRFALIFRKWEDTLPEFEDMSTKAKDYIIKTFTSYAPRPIKGQTPEKIALLLWSTCIGALTLENMHLLAGEEAHTTNPEDLMLTIFSLLTK